MSSNGQCYSLLVLKVWISGLFICNGDIQLLSGQWDNCFPLKASHVFTLSLFPCIIGFLLALFSYDFANVF